MQELRDQLDDRVEHEDSAHLDRDSWANFFAAYQ